MKRPFSWKWNHDFYTELINFQKIQVRISKIRTKNITRGLTMPDLSQLSLGSAKKMLAAIMFFDLEHFTSITSKLPNESTLHYLNCSLPSLIKIVRKWNGYIEKNTGDGFMAIIGTDESDPLVIARNSIECAMAIRYFMINDINTCISEQFLPKMNFRIGIDMQELLISRIGVIKTNFLTVVGDAANRASKLQSLAKPNGICIGENIARNLHPFHHNYLEAGDDANWNWKRPSGDSYQYFHYMLDLSTPKEWNKWMLENIRKKQF